MTTKPEREALEQAVVLQREVARRQALAQPAAFAALYLPHYVTADPAPFHHQLFEAMRRVDDAPRRAWAAPRGHAKSTLVTLVFVLWLLCTERKRLIVLCSETESQAERFLDDVRHEFEHNMLLQEDFGDMVGRTWRRDQLLTARGGRVVALGTGSSMRGLRSGPDRPDLIICDDIENDATVATAEQRRKVRRWFARTLVNTLDPVGAVWVMGTILHHDSLLAALTKGNVERGQTAWPGRVWRALDDDDTALWPAVWPVEKLKARRREIGSTAFAQEFQNRPVAPEEALFRPEWLESPHIWFDSAPNADDLLVFQAVDPAISQSSHADYFCHVTLGRHADTGDLFLLDIVRERMTFDRQVRTLIERHNRWQPIRIGVESVAYQAGLADAVLAQAALPIEKIVTPSDKIARALRLSAVIETGKLKLPRGDARMRPLLDELTDFPHGAHDDQIDALGYACALATEDIQPRIWVL